MSLCHRTLIFFFFFFLLSLTFLNLASATFTVHSHGDSKFTQPPQTSPKPSSGWESKEAISEGPSVGPVDEYDLSSSFPLAAQRTHRKDPLNGFRKYSGGWNLSEHHYWSSVGFTAVPLFAIALLWFTVFGLFLSLFCLHHLCCKRRQYGYSKTAYTLSLIFLIIFSIAAIAGCVVLYNGQEHFHRSTTSTLDYVMSQADFTVGKLKNVSDHLVEAKQLGVDQVFLPSNVQTDIDQIATRINASASNLADSAAESSDDIRSVLDSVRLGLIVVAAIMLVVTFLGLLFSLFGMKQLVYCLVIIGWILVGGTFILCGVFVLLHNVAGDTCVAMNEWTLNPTAHTAIDEIMPCIDKTTAQQTLQRSKEVTSELVDLINEVITNVSNINFAPNFVPLYFNQSGPLVPLLCNPYFHDLTDRACSPGEVELYNATQVWSGFVCQVLANGFCSTVGRLTPTFYSQMSTGVDISIVLNDQSPFLVDLQDCTFARETFAHIYSNHCPSLKRYSKWIYIGLVLVSTAIMMSLVFWVIYGRERRRRIDAKQLADIDTDDDNDQPQETNKD